MRDEKLILELTKEEAQKIKTSLLHSAAMAIDVNYNQMKETKDMFLRLLEKALDDQNLRER